MFLTIVIFIFILSVLVLVHEFGHFIVAKKSGAKVEEFGVGFPPRIFGIKIGETVYSVNLFPIGGFVRIYGEEGEDSKNSRSFASKSISVRSLIVASGILMNLALAVILFSVGYAVGLPQAFYEGDIPDNVRNISVRIAYIAEDSPASRADINLGDRIVGMKAGMDELEEVKSIEDVKSFTSSHLEEDVRLFMKRGKTLFETSVVPRSNHPENEGAIGIEMALVGDVFYPLHIAPLKGIETTFLFTIATAEAFKDMVSDFLFRGVVEEEVSGPVGIFMLTGEVRQLGSIFVLQFIALISINLAIINSIPFPALDGGRILFFAIEAIKGSPVNRKYEKIAHTVGFYMLIALVILITFRDVGKLFP
ncbi:MAG: hypothetical protein A3B96_03395 [Candidatus Spechtbacteria bacterium RIFCSPHIGHO2_02_FULL_43_15b]|uniref:Peptidase M50 domain-containing protein n=1 Tax=Candidatus Spechtbacteria bacterium RIFCSPHIGHO2_01_FULL_43_30 TaxID=1802158 RepID=A0A1G2H714_9BACT|nr:MAG: hypothetical protein A2827_02450 [Candidatus Spechtbacteria bacterium RIFCSPHIGHO2_01_FULL_43_30]OGZ59398.1 MAG: hypothetical protein A3B96_03395 [Candidatus Spechtbacteria bacterium RIFCSPHIGHO2_02_FULL_43_15b]